MYGIDYPAHQYRGKTRIIINNYMPVTWTQEERRLATPRKPLVMSYSQAPDEKPVLFVVFGGLEGANQVAESEFGPITGKATSEADSLDAPGGSGDLQYQLST